MEQRTIDHYLDAAKIRAGLANDSALADALGVKKAAVSTYRTKRNWPDDATMRRLADLAGIAPEIALAELGLKSGLGKGFQGWVGPRWPRGISRS